MFFVLLGGFNRILNAAQSLLRVLCFPILYWASPIFGVYPIFSCTTPFCNHSSPSLQPNHNCKVVRPSMSRLTNFNSFFSALQIPFFRQHVSVDCFPLHTPTEVSSHLFFLLVVFFLILLLLQTEELELRADSFGVVSISLFKSLT